MTRNSPAHVLALCAGAAILGWAPSGFAVDSGPKVKGLELNKGDKAESRDKAGMMQDELGTPTSTTSADGSGMAKPSERGALLSLQFFDALTANPVPGATVRFNDETATTDERGIAQFPFPDVPEDKELTMAAEFSKGGARVRRGDNLPESQRAYVTCRVPVHFMLGTIFFNRYSISPALDPGKLRIVVEWDRSPRDLDALLVRAGGYHISFRNMRNYKDVVFLDHDAMNGFGPETITIEQVDPAASYSYYVHDFTNARNPGSSELSQSRARVLVFDSRGLVKAYMIGSGTGVTWKVFDVVGGEVKSVDKISSDLPR